jgi:hypothetical protein
MITNTDYSLNAQLEVCVCVIVCMRVFVCTDHLVCVLSTDYLFGAFVKHQPHVRNSRSTRMRK